MEDELVINTKMDTKGFEAGSKRLLGAIKSFGNTASRTMQTVERSGNKIFRTIMKWGPALLGVRGAYQMVSRAVQSFLAENQKLSADLSSAWRALGNVLGPIITQVIGWITTAVSYFVNFLKLLGLTSKSASEASKSAKGAGQELRRQLMGFDELNVLSDNQGTYSGQLTDKELPEWLKTMADLLKKGQFEEAGRTLARRMNEIIASIKWDELGQKVGKAFDGVLKFLYGAIDEFDFRALGEDLATALSSFVETVDWKYLGYLVVGYIRGIFEFVAGFLDPAKLHYAEISDAIYQALIGAFESLDTFFKETDWEELANKILTAFDDFMGGFTGEGKLTKFATTFGNLLRDSILSGVTFAKTIVNGIWNRIRVAWNSLSADENGNFSMAHLRQALASAWDKSWNWIKVYIVQPFFEALGLEFLNDENNTALGNIATNFSSALGAALGNAINFAFDIVEKVWQAISDEWGEYKLTDEEGKFDLGKLKDALLNGWKNIGAWIRQNIVEPFFTAFANVFGIKVKNSANTDWVQELRDKISEKIKNVFGDNAAGLFDDLTSAIETAIDKIRSFFSGTGGEGEEKQESSGIASLFTDLGNVIDLFNRTKISLLDGMWGMIETFFSHNNGGQPTALQGLLESVHKAITDVAGIAGDIFNSAWTIISTFLGHKGEEVGGTGEKSGLEKLLDGVSSIIGGISDKIDEASPFFTDLVNLLGDIGNLTINDLVPEFLTAVGEGISSLNIGTNLRNIVGNLKNLFNDFLGPAAGVVISEGVPAFFSVLSSSLSIINSVIDYVMPGLISLWTDFLSPLLSNTFTGVTNFFRDTATFLDLIAKRASGEITWSEFSDGLGRLLSNVDNMEAKLDTEEKKIEYIGENIQKSFDWMATVGDSNISSENAISAIASYFDQIGYSIDGCEDSFAAAEKFLDTISNAEGLTFADEIGIVGQIADSTERAAAAEDLIARITSELNALMPEYAEAIEVVRGNVVSLTGTEGDLESAINDCSGVLRRASEDLTVSSEEEKAAKLNALTEAYNNLATNINSTSLSNEEARQSYSALSYLLETLKSEFPDVAEEMGIYTSAQELMNGIAEQYVPILLAQGKGYEEIAQALGISSDEVERMANATIQANESTQETTNAVGELKEGYEESGDAATDAGESYGDMSENAKKAAEELKSSNSIIVVDSKEFAGDIEKSTGEAADSFEAMHTDIGTTLNLMDVEFTIWGETLVTSLKETCDALQSSWNICMNEMLSRTRSGMTNIKTVAQNAMTELRSNAYNWGSDMMRLYGNGIVNGFTAYTLPALKSVTSRIRSYLHFSEPDEGPLSDFHTYMPDMMKLMAEGIKNNAMLPLNEVANLTAGISDQFTSLNTASIVSQLQSIAESVAYQAPSVAMGTTMPYSVSSQNAQNAHESTYSMEDVVNAINGLKSFLNVNSSDDRDYSFNIYLDGQQITNVVTKRQIRESIARGTY